MSTRSLLVPVAFVFAASLIPGACGNGGSEDEASIKEVIDESLTGTDPATCTTLQTQQFTEQTQFESDQAALASCEEDSSDSSDDPDSVEISNVEVEGSNATADVRFEGSVLDGSTVTVSLVQERDQWKLDRLEDIPDFAFGPFNSAFSDQLARDGDVPPEVSECITQALSKSDPEAVKGALLSGNEDQLVALFGECVPGA